MAMKGGQTICETCGETLRQRDMQWHVCMTSEVIARIGEAMRDPDCPSAAILMSDYYQIAKERGLPGRTQFDRHFGSYAAAAVYFGLTMQSKRLSTQPAARVALPPDDDTIGIEYSRQVVDERVQVYPDRMVRTTRTVYMLR